MVLGLLDQLQFFSQLYLMKLLGLLTGVGLLELWHLICQGFQQGFVCLSSSKSYGISGQIFGLIFSVIDSFEWFWMKSLHKNIKFMLEFPKAPVLVPQFSYYTLMTFLTIVFVLIILLSILSVISDLICGSNLNWLVNLNLV